MGIALILMAVGMMLGFGAEAMVEAETEAEGSENSDRIDGTERDDNFRGAAGDDLLLGNGGNDNIFGDGGNDWIFGMHGLDTLTGGAGNDVLVGGAGADAIDAGDGDDFVEAANLLDADALAGSLTGANSFADIAFTYDLSLQSDAGDAVDLGAGDDTVVVGANDTVTGAEGADKFATGDWIETHGAAYLPDFDPAEDILTFAYDDAGRAPDLTIQVDPVRGGVTLLNHGEPIALIGAAPGTITTSDVMLVAYAR